MTIPNSLVLGLGQSVPCWEATTHTKVRLRFTLLHNWMNVSHTVVTPNPPGGLVLQLNARPDAEIELADGTKLTFEPDIGSPSFRDGFHIVEDHYISLEFPKAVTVATIRTSYVNVLRRLLTLFTGNRVFEERLNVEVSDGGGPPSYAEWLWSNEGVSEAKTDVHSLHMTVPYGEITSAFPGILRRWFDYHQKLDSALDLYFGVVFNRNLWINQRFLFLAQALEVYHNSNPEFVGSVQTKDDFRTRRERIIMSAPDGERGWLREKLHYANQKTLAERLADILAKHKAEAEQFIPDLQRFADRVRHTRNYYTHFDEELRESGKLAEDDELTMLVFRMQTLLGVCILKDLGIAGAPVARLINTQKGVRLVSLHTQPPQT